MTCASQQRFVLIGQARSGTWLCIETLDQHPEVIAAGELFHYTSEVRRSMFANVLLDFEPSLEVNAINGDLDGYFYRPMERAHPTVRAVGFKLLYEHANLAWARGDVGVEQARELKILHLVRRNPFDVMCSWWIACLEQVWWNSPTTRTIRIEPSTALTWLEHRERWLNWVRNLSTTRKVLELDYDLLVQRPQTEMNRMCDFLEIDPIRIDRPILNRQEHRPLSQKIENFDRLIEGLRGTKWESYLLEEVQADG